MMVVVEGGAVMLLVDKMSCLALRTVAVNKNQSKGFIQVGMEESCENLYHFNQLYANYRSPLYGGRNFKSLVDILLLGRRKSGGKGTLILLLTKKYKKRMLTLAQFWYGSVKRVFFNVNAILINK